MSFLLNPSELVPLSTYLSRQGWLKGGEVVESAARAGDGNMNCVVRVRTSARTFILKQARPWVEKYPHIAAPVDRIIVEAAFYREARRNEVVRRSTPDVFGFDSTEHVLLMQDLGGAADLSWLYDSPERPIPETDLDSLIAFLIALHTNFRDESLAQEFANLPMRQLNHQHVFVLPLAKASASAAPSTLAKSLHDNPEYLARVQALGEKYLSCSGPRCLLHGDFFPGSWLKSHGAVFVIDPEFSFYGPPEWDLGVMLAHLYLARQPAATIAKVLRQYSASGTTIESSLVRGFAGVEIMRRLIGVAQLPLPYGVEEKQRLLNQSVTLVLGVAAE